MNKASKIAVTIIIIEMILNIAVLYIGLIVIGG